MYSLIGTGWRGDDVFNDETVKCGLSLATNHLDYFNSTNLYLQHIYDKNGRL